MPSHSTNQQALIPFALSKTDGLLRDVHDVPRGKSCGCVCPSCHGELIAHQGEVYGWHFKHAPRSYDQVCEYTWYLSLKDMITQLMAAGTEIRLPALSYNSEYDSVLLLNEQLVRSITVKKESTTNQSSYDLQCELSDGQLLLSMFRSSGNQRFANAEYPPKRILALRLDRINLSNAEYTDYKQAICQFLEVETVGKEWISHPRLTQYVAELEAEERQRRRDEELLQQQLLDFECIMCHVTWRGTNKERTCAKCGKHVYTREI